jgi:hypothetical protein
MANGIASVGRFNQRHLATHRMSKVDERETLLHQLIKQNPGVPIPSLIQWASTQFRMLEGVDDEEGEEGEGDGEEEEEEEHETDQGSERNS